MVDDMQPKGLCENCGKRPATSWWTGEGGTLAFVHGMGVPWCRVCCLTEQVRYLEEKTAALPKIKAQLAELLLAECLEP